MNSSIINELINLLDSKRVLTDPSELISYSYDNSRYQGLPDCVIFPHNTDEVAAAVKLCNLYNVSIVARGKGSATTGASVPTQGGIVFAFEQMHKIIELNVADRYLVSQPGVTNATVQAKAAEQGFFWAPDPSSASTCTIGGNLACNAAGPRAVKYGTTRDNTLGLTVVTGNGDIMKVGCYTTKGVVGYDFTRLLIGSEGTLGLITEAILKLLPLPEAKASLQLFYDNVHDCAKAITSIMSEPNTPYVLEFIDNHCLNILRQQHADSIPEAAKAMLILEVAGLHFELENCVNHMATAAKNSGLILLRTAKNADETSKLWHLRKSLSPALRGIAPKKINEDIVIPVSRLPEYVNFTEELAKQYQLTIVNFGHAGNGNLHTNIMLDPSDSIQDKNSHLCLDEIFAKVLELNGTLSGEHGVGIDKRQFIAAELDTITIQMMHNVKKVFDPKGLLNPGKAIPDLIED